jgi:hypothetical protein
MHKKQNIGAGGVAQVVEPSKSKTLSSNSSTTKKVVYTCNGRLLSLKQRKKSHHRMNKLGGHYVK